MEKIVRLLSRLSLRTHYRFADYLLYPALFYVVRYRRRLVEKNLRLSFPEKTEAERREIEKKFYHHLADITVECIYGYGISAEEMAERVRFSPHEETVRLINQYGSVIVMLAHLGNWEWLADYNQHLVPEGIEQANIYRQQTNASMDKTIAAIRSKRGGILIEKRKILRQMLLLRKEEKKMLFGLISDQKPRPEVCHYWTEFLHQETGFLDGGEVLGKKFGYPVLYAHIRCPKRGYYDIEFKMLSEHPAETAENEITRLYAEYLEQNILEQPEIWLWTHNRWKWSRPKKEGETHAV